MKYIFGFFILFLVSSFFIVPSLHAQGRNQFRGSPVVTLPYTSTVENDYFAAGKSVTVSGTIGGDAYVAGGTVTIDGTIDGDLLVAGGTVSISGTVGQNIRVAGGTVTISGRVGRNISIAAGSVSIEKTARIGGNIVGVFGNLAHMGQTAGDMTVAGGDAVINGAVGANVVARVGSLTISEKATVVGNLKYESPSKAEISSLAQINGTISYTPSRWNEDMRNKEMSVGGVRKQVHAGVELISLITSFMMGFIIMRFFPRRFARTAEIIKQRFWNSLALGLLVSIVTPVAVILLLVTIVGIPFALLWTVGFFILAYIAKIWVGFSVGRMILVRSGVGDRRGWALLLGLLLYYIIGYIPYIGWLMKLLVMMGGIGVVLIERREFYHQLVTKKLV